jgi:hypothetical protein
VWAASDNTIVLLCQRKVAATRKAEEEKEELFAQQQRQYQAGTLLDKAHKFTYGRSSSDDDFLDDPPKSKCQKKLRKPQLWQEEPSQKKIAQEREASEEEMREVQQIEIQRRLEEEEDTRVLNPDPVDAVEARPITEQKDGEQKDGEQTRKKDGEDTRMVWRHTSKMCLFGWVLKLNPFAAKRGGTEEAWNNVAQKCAESTKHVTKREG